MNRKTWIATIVIGALLIGAMVWRNISQSELKKDGVIVQAKILRVNFGGKTSGGFQCLFEYKGQSIELPSPSSVTSGKFKLIGKNFPAVYLPNTNTLEVLVTPVDFEKFNLPFPDSLDWIWKINLKVRE